MAPRETSSNLEHQIADLIYGGMTLHPTVPYTLVAVWTGTVHVDEFDVAYLMAGADERKVYLHGGFDPRSTLLDALLAVSGVKPL